MRPSCPSPPAAQLPSAPPNCSRGGAGGGDSRRPVAHNHDVRIPEDAVIAEEKLTKYLLVHREWDDKSGFLRRAGFETHNWPALRAAIRDVVATADAVEDGLYEYGVFYRADGLLVGPLASAPVQLIWMRRAVDDRIYFVPLKPQKAQKPGRI